MLIRRAILERIAAGEVTLAFRRWVKPTVRAGTGLKTAIGVVEIEGVESVEELQLSDEEARRAGFSSREDLLADLRGGPGRTLYRISLRFGGEDPRAALRETTPDAAELDRILKRLARMDAGRDAPWTRATLAAIAERPEAAAADLAKSLGRDKLALKADIRKLNELGLTESYSVGYRLSPRGRRVLTALA